LGSQKSIGINIYASHYAFRRECICGKFIKYVGGEFVETLREGIKSDYVFIFCLLSVCIYSFVDTIRKMRMT